MKNNHSLIFAIGILIIISLSWIIPIVNADDTGFISPENFPLNYNDWNAPENAFSQDDSYSLSLGGDSRADEQTFYEFNGLDEIFDNIDGCPTIDGIEFRFDAYASGSGATYDVKLTWDLGTTYTSAKTSASLGTSDTDTYITVGGSSDTWGRTWDKTELLPDAFGVYIKSNTNYRTYYCDHIQVKVYYTYEVPEPPNTPHITNRINYCNQSQWNWVKGTGADYTMWRVSSVDYPTLTTGTLVYNGTSGSFNCNYDVLGLSYNTQYYICGFSWNTTYCCWGDNEEDYWFSTPCNHKINTINNNTAYTDNGYEYSYSPYNGYTWYLNYTGILPTLNVFDNVDKAIGTHENNTENGGHTINIWLNYTSGIWYDETGNGNVTGWVTSAWNYDNGTYQVMTFYDSYITLYEAITDATGTHELQWNGTHYKVWANYTGSGASCDLQYFNYSDDNITINITYYGCNNTNTSDYEINNESWLYTAGTILFDNGQVFLIILISLWIYFVNKYYQTKDALFVYIQLGVVIPLTILISIIAFEFVFGYIVVFILPAISIYLFIDKYEKDKKIKEELEKRGLIDD